MGVAPPAYWVGIPGRPPFVTPCARQDETKKCASAYYNHQARSGIHTHYTHGTYVGTYLQTEVATSHIPLSIL